MPRKEKINNFKSKTGINDNSLAEKYLIREFVSIGMKMKLLNYISKKIKRIRKVTKIKLKQIKIIKMSKLK